MKEKVSVTRDNAKPVYLAEGVTLEEKQSAPLNPFNRKLMGRKKKSIRFTGTRAFLQRALAEYDADKEVFSMNTDIKVTGKELGINDDLTFALNGQMKIKDVDFDVEYKDATNLDDLKFILKSEVENNLKYTFNYSHCFGGKVACDKKMPKH